MMTSPFFFRRTVTTVVTVSAAFTLGAGCTDSTALDLSPLPLAAADIDAERAMVVACTADPAVRNVVGGLFPPRRASCESRRHVRQGSHGRVPDSAIPGK